MIYRIGDKVQAKVTMTAGMLDVMTEKNYLKTIVPIGAIGTLMAQNDDYSLVADWGRFGTYAVRFDWIEPEIKTPGLTFQNVAVWDIYGIENVWNILIDVCHSGFYTDVIAVPINDEMQFRLEAIDNEEDAKTMPLILQAYKEAKNRDAKYLIVMDSTNEEV